VDVQNHYRGEKTVFRATHGGKNVKSIGSLGGRINPKDVGLAIPRILRKKRGSQKGEK